MCVCGMGGEGSVCEKVLYIVCIVYYCNHGKYTAPTYIICKLTMQLADAVFHTGTRGVPRGGHP